MTEVGVGMPASSGDSWARRVRGCLLWSACGDALGAPFEGMRSIDPDAVRRRLDDPPPVLRWTDDTASTLVLAGHLARRGGTVDQRELAADLAAQWARDPGRGYGAGASWLFARITEGVPWSQAASALFGGQGSFGNGAAMRVAPVGLVAGLGPSAVAGRARRSAMVTHTHPAAQDGAVVQAVAVATAARSNPASPLAPDTFVAELSRHVATEGFRTALRKVAVLVRGGARPGQVAAEVGNGVSAVGSVPAALAAFLSVPDDPVAVVRFAIGTGGDSDTIAAMGGALAGARCGDRALPPAWRDRLEAADTITAVAARLARLAPC